MYFCVILSRVCGMYAVVRITSYYPRRWTKPFVCGTYHGESASAAFNTLTLSQQLPFIPRLSLLLFTYKFVLNVLDCCFLGRGFNNAKVSGFLCLPLQTLTQSSYFFLTKTKVRVKLRVRVSET